MSKQMNLDEMIIAAANSDMPNLDQYVEHLTKIAQQLGDDLAAHLGIEGPPVCDLTAEEGCGIMGGFSPLHAGQPIPPALKMFDTTGDWVPDERRRPEAGGHPATSDPSELADQAIAHEDAPGGELAADPVRAAADALDAEAAQEGTAHDAQGVADSPPAYLNSCHTVSALLGSAHAAAMALPVGAVRGALLRNLKPFESGVAVAFYNREEMREQTPPDLEERATNAVLDLALEEMVRNFPHPWDEMSSYVRAAAGMAQARGPIATVPQAPSAAKPSAFWVLELGTKWYWARTRVAKPSGGPYEKARGAVSQGQYALRGESRAIHAGEPPVAEIVFSRSTEESIAAAFLEELERAVGSAGLSIIARHNADEADPMICHSHDLCDANQLMAAAFKKVLGFEHDTRSETQAELWNLAWSEARRALGERFPPEVAQRPRPIG